MAYCKHFDPFIHSDIFFFFIESSVGMSNADTESMFQSVCGYNNNNKNQIKMTKHLPIVYRPWSHFRSFMDAIRLIEMNKEKKKNIYGHLNNNFGMQ